MSREFRLRIEDMLAEIAIIERMISGLNRETFSRNQQAIRVVLYGLAVIGEAVASCLTELKAADPKVPWVQIRGMRNMVVHEYFRVDSSPKEGSSLQKTALLFSIGQAACSLLKK